MQHPRFRRGDLATDFIADEYPDGFDGAPADEQLLDDLALIAGKVAGDQRRARDRDQRPAGRADPAPVASASSGSPARDHKVRIRPTKAARWRSSTAATCRLSSRATGGRGSDLLSVNIDGRHRIVQVRRAGRDWELQTRGASHRVKVHEPARRRARPAHDRQAAARPVAPADRADAGASDAARRRGRRQGRGRASRSR